MASVDFQQPDRVPIFELWIDEPILYDLAHILGLRATFESEETLSIGEDRAEPIELYCLLVEELGLDATSLTTSKGWEPAGENRFKDKYDCVFTPSEHGDAVLVEGPIARVEDLDGFEIHSRIERHDFAEAQYVIERIGHHKAHVMGIRDPFKISWLLRGGMEPLLLDYARNPDMVHKLARIGTDYCLRFVELASELGIDALVMDGDLAGEKSTIISPHHYREFIYPYHREIVVRAHKVGLRIIKHTDGNAWTLLDDFAEIGFDGFNPIQPQCMDIGEVKQHLAGRMSLIGNIDCRTLLPFGSKEEVKKTVKETIEIAAPGGGYVMCSSNSIHPGCKAENYLAMVEAAHKYGSYTP